MDAAHFDRSDFYPLETLLRAKFHRKWYGGYEKTMKVTWSSEVVQSDGEVEHESCTLDSVIDCTGMDLVKLCMSFVFWTREGRQFSAHMLQWLRRSVLLQLIYQVCNDGSKGLRDRIDNDIKGWDHWTLTAAVLYILKYTSRASDWHHAIVRELLTKFLGADGYGHRDYVFGNTVSTVSTVSASTSVHTPYTVPHIALQDVSSLDPDYIFLQLVAIYNNALARCSQVTSLVNGLNLGIVDARAVKKLRDDLILFLTVRLGASGRTADRVIEGGKRNKVPLTIDKFILHTDQFLTLYERQTEEASEILYRVIHNIKGTKNFTPEECPYCWMTKNGIDKSCKQHARSAKNIPTAPSNQSAYSVVTMFSAVPSATTAVVTAPTAPSVPIPSAPPVDSLPASQLECSVCLTARINTRISPCGHTCCNTCAGVLISCPLCRREITSRDIIYI